MGSEGKEPQLSPVTPASKQGGLQLLPHEGTHSGKLLQDTAELSSCPGPYLSLELRERVGRRSHGCQKSA